MARSRPSNPKEKARRAKSKLHRVQASPSKRREPTSAQLLAEATSFLHAGDPESALPLALRALVLSNPNSCANVSSQSVTHTPASLPAISLLAEINIELGDVDAARNYFLQAVALDPDLEISETEGGGVEKALWLAQLCEEGGEESVRWFERGAEVLRRDIAKAEEMGTKGELVQEKKRKLAGALCGIVEVYMTDLSHDPLAETHCLTRVNMALALLPHSPAPHQTHASVLISQRLFPAARTALRTSLSLWRALPPSHPDVPDFPARISLVRLLLEVGMEKDALRVVDGVVSGDEGCVEGWYLGGWGLWILGDKNRRSEAGVLDDHEMAETNEHESEEEESESARKKGKDRGWIESWRSSLQWLRTCLQLYGQLDYEDERLRDHALELVQGIENEFAAEGVKVEIDEEREEEEWESGDEEDEKEEDGGGDDDQMIT
ncbi:hypothetical protein MMC07_000283 [Pseudocyphellaria aurata]|nr:hypothetical protein [Pseudocyphellaria aurata]